MVQRLRDLLRESIRKRMMSDVPFGVFLSGGVDSSANVALMAELVDQPVRTFSTAPSGHARYDERELRAADRRALRNRSSRGGDRRAPTCRSSCREMVHHQDEPAADATAIPQHFVAELARETGTIVVQCGEGSDELFHGYKGYADHRRYVASVPAAARSRCGAASGPSPRARTRRLGQRHPPRRGAVRRRRAARFRTGAARCASEARSRSRSCAATAAARRRTPSSSGTGTTPSARRTAPTCSRR